MEGKVATATSDSFAYSFDEENYNGEFASEEEALKEAIADRPDETIIHIGKIIPISAEEILPDAHHIVERAQDYLCDRVGDISESYLDGCFKGKDARAITADLHEAIVAVFVKHGIDLHPTCWSVADVKTVEREVTQADTGKNEEAA